MIEIFGEEYYIDLEELDEFLIIKERGLNDSEIKDETKKTIESFSDSETLIGREIITEEHPKHKEINGVKFEIMRGFINDLGEGEDSFDSTLASRNLKKTSVRFKLAFNTLLYYDILKKLD